MSPGPAEFNRAGWRALKRKPATWVRVLSTNKKRRHTLIRFFWLVSWANIFAQPVRRCCSTLFWL